MPCYKNCRFVPIRRAAFASHYLSFHMKIDSSKQTSEMRKALDLREGRDYIFYTDEVMRIHNDKVDVSRIPLTKSEIIKQEVEASLRNPQVPL